MKWKNTMKLKNCSEEVEWVMVHQGTIIKYIYNGVRKRVLLKFTKEQEAVQKFLSRLKVQLQTVHRVEESNTLRELIDPEALISDGEIKQIKIIKLKKSFKFINK